MQTKRDNRRFQRGSGCFTCKSCKKQTRNTGDNGSCNLCPLCFEKSSVGNSLSDNGWGDWSDLDACTTVAEVYEKFEALRLKHENSGQPRNLEPVSEGTAYDSQGRKVRVSIPH